MSQRAAIYCRISLDSEGDELGVRRQEDDCRALAEQRGLEVIEVFADNDMGASTRSKAKRRPAFEQMLDGARAGRFGVVLAYSNSRLTRRPMELETLIALHESHGVRIETVVSGSDDLATADGRMVARIKANVDAAEAERISERVARKHLENARSGKPVGGTRPFGWQDDKITVKPAEATLIRQAVADLGRGVPLRQIVTAWNTAEVPTSRGAQWSPQTVRQMLKSPRLAGYRVHRGNVALDAAGRPVRGRWDPILTDEQHLAVVARLTQPEGRSRVPRRGSRHYLLTGLLRCGVCNAPMYGNRTGDTFVYRCDAGNGHSNAVNGPKTDGIVTKLVLARLADEDLSDALPEPTTDNGRIEEIGAKIEELMGAYVRGTLTGALVFPAVEQLEEERAALRRERSAAASVNHRPTVTHMTPEQSDALSVAERREVCEIILAAVLVKPATRRGNTFQPERVEHVWRKA